MVFEALALACPATASFLSIHNMVGGMIDRFASPEARARWLAPLIAMDKIFSYCLTEPGAGSDAAALTTRAERAGEGWRLNGTKAFISGGSYSDVYLAMVRSGGPGPGGISAILVEDGTKGLSFGGLGDKMGWRAQPTAWGRLDDFEVPGGNLLGGGGAGFLCVLAGVAGGRFGRLGPRLVRWAVYSAVVGVATEPEVLRALGIEPDLRSLVTARRQTVDFLRAALVLEDDD